MSGITWKYENYSQHAPNSAMTISDDSLSFWYTNPLSIPLQLAEEAIKNLWYLNKYKDDLIAHIEGFSTEEEFTNKVKKYIKVKNNFSKKEIIFSSKYLHFIIPEIDIDDVSDILNVDLSDVVSAFKQIGAITDHE